MKTTRICSGSGSTTACAELTFTHWALGLDPRRFLLDPAHLPAARERLASLGWCARSLGVLVPEEGRLLAGRLIAAWTRQAGQIDPAYTVPSDDSEARASNSSIWRHLAISLCSA